MVSEAGRETPQADEGQNEENEQALEEINVVRRELERKRGK